MDSETEYPAKVTGHYLRKTYTHENYLSKKPAGVVAASLGSFHIPENGFFSTT
jgi:hypothetical protein